MFGFSTVHFIYSIFAATWINNGINHLKTMYWTFQLIFFCTVCYIHVAYRKIYVKYIYVKNICVTENQYDINKRDLSPSFTKFDSGSCVSRSDSSSGRDLWPSFTNKLITATASLEYLWKGGVCAVDLFSYLDVHRRRRIQVYKLVY